MGKIGKAQLKITTIVVYYTILGVVGLASYTYYDVGESYQRRIAEYVLCESSGVSNCELVELGVEATFLSTLILSMISFLPVVSIIFTFDPKAYKKNATKSRNKPGTFTRSTTATSQIYVRSNTATSDIFARSNSTAFRNYTRSNTASSDIFVKSKTATSQV